jgi:hypothetical protein
MFKRIVYVPYYIVKTDWLKFSRYMNYARKNGGKSRIIQLLDVAGSVLRYNIAPLDYYYFGFYNIHRSERKKYAGTGFMYEYQKLMNPFPDREILADKILNHYKDLIHRKYQTISEFKKNPDYLQQMLISPVGKIVLKNARGQVGAEVEIYPFKGKKPDEILLHMKKRRFDLIEEYVVQHPKLMELSPSGLNTVRIITQHHSGRVEIFAARLRISVNSSVDNMAAGNLAAPLDVKSGIVTGPAVYSDITKPTCEIHPVTGIRIKGFTIPYWSVITELVKQAAKRADRNRSIGWDIAITSDGPELIEGNHNWCKLLWQLPVKQGLKSELEKYLLWKES